MRVLCILWWLPHLHSTPKCGIKLKKFFGTKTNQRNHDFNLKSPITVICPLAQSYPWLFGNIQLETPGLCRTGICEGDWSLDFRWFDLIYCLLAFLDIYMNVPVGAAGVRGLGGRGYLAYAGVGRGCAAYPLKADKRPDDKLYDLLPGMELTPMNPVTLKPQGIKHAPQVITWMWFWAWTRGRKKQKHTHKYT